MSSSRDKILLLGKLFKGYKGSVNYNLAKVGVGVFSDMPAFMSLKTDGFNKIVLTTFYRVGLATKELTDTISFPYVVAQITRKKSIVSDNIEDYYTFTPVSIADNDMDKKTFYVRLINGDLYVLTIYPAPTSLQTEDNTLIKSENNQMFASKISEKCVFITDGEYVEEKDDDIAVKVGNRIIRASNISNNWYAVSFFPNPTGIIFLGFKKGEYKLGSTINLKLVHKNSGYYFDVTKLDGGVKKAVYVNQNFFVLTESGSVYKMSHLENKITKIDNAVDLGVYWTEVRALRGGCVNHIPVKAQEKYLVLGCAFSNPSKISSVCHPSGWGGVSIGKSAREDVEMRTVGFPTACYCKYYQDVKNVFDGVSHIGVPVYKTEDGKWHSLYNKFKVYNCDGQHPVSSCISDNDKNIKETIEAIDFYMQNKQKDNLLNCISVEGSYYELPAIGTAPLKIKYTEGKINL